MNEPIEMEIVQPDDKLVKYAAELGLEKAATVPLFYAFRPIYRKAYEAIAAAAGLAEAVKDATCVTEIRACRAKRLELRKIRNESDTTREREKKGSLLYGKAVQGFHNILMADLVPVEDALQAAEDTAERAETARKDALEQGRKAALAPYVADVALYAVRDMTEPAFTALLTGVRVAKEQADAAVAKAEADRIAREKEEAAERERVRAENERLQKEAAEKEAALKAERERVQAAWAAEIAKVEAVNKAEREAAAKKLADERAIFEAQRKAEQEAAFAAAQVVRKENEAKAAIAAKEAARLRAELEARQKAEAAAKAKAEAEARAAALAAKKAAAAPDKAKLKAFADALSALELPNLNDQAASTELLARVIQLVQWCEGKAQNDP